MAVFTHLTEQQIVTFLAGYTLPPLQSVAPILSGNENSNYKLVLGCEDYVLTVFEHRTAHKDLTWFVSLLDHMANAGLTTPKVMVTDTNQALQTVAGKPAMLQSFLKGSTPDALTIDHAHQAGQFLASLHQLNWLGIDKRPSDFSLAKMQKTVSDLSEALNTISPNFRAIAQKTLAQIDSALRDMSLPKSIIHGDLFPDNVFFEGGHLSGVFDFYFASHDDKLFDLAVAIMSWAFDRENRLLPAIANGLLAGYQSKCPLTDDEKSALKHLMKKAALRFALTRAEDRLNIYNVPNLTAKDPLQMINRLAMVDGYQPIFSPS